MTTTGSDEPGERPPAEQEGKPFRPRIGWGLTRHLGKLAQGLKLVSLLLFLLPWVTVSCAEQTLVTMSGAELAAGSVTVMNPLTGESATPPDNQKADIPVLIAALLIAGTLLAGLLFRRTLASVISVGGLAAAAALIIYGVLFSLPERAREVATADSAEGISEVQISELIRVDVAAGFWLTLAALLAAIAVNILALRQARPGT